MSWAVPGIALGAFLLGLLGGALFVGSLWRTVNETVNARRPGLRLVLGFALRLGVVLSLLYLAARLGGWPALLAATAGFLVARTMGVGMVRRRIARPSDAP